MLRGQLDGIFQIIEPRFEPLFRHSPDKIEADIGKTGRTQRMVSFLGVMGEVGAAEHLQIFVVKGLHA